MYLVAHLGSLMFDIMVEEGTKVSNYVKNSFV